jgi:hypothetical protein
MTPRTTAAMRLSLLALLMAGLAVAAPVLG